MQVHWRHFLVVLKEKSQKLTIVQTPAVCSQSHDPAQEEEWRRLRRHHQVQERSRRQDHLYPFMNVETAEPQELIPGLDKDRAARTTAPEPRIQPQEVQDKVSNT